MRKTLLLLVATLFFLFGCEKQNNDASLNTGIYRAVIEIQGQELPFNFELINRKGGGYIAYLLNAGERILLDEITVKGDSVDFALHIFDANIKASVKGDSLIGEFVKNYETDYRLPFYAVHGQSFRFSKKTDASPTANFSGKYDVAFINNDNDTTHAIGIFHQQDDSVTGTFLTTTGDYRYLQGRAAGNEMRLSTFDGNHTYLFIAEKTGEGKLEGDFYSGKTSHKTWTAVSNENATLPDAESLTYLKDGYETIDFTFPDINGDSVSLDDKKYENKVVILQLFGTWCPNCMDETQFLTEWYDQNKERGVEIIGLAFERKDDFEYASNRVRKMIEKYGVNYDFVIAGTNEKEQAAKSLPMLNSVVAFPTTIFIGRDGKVKKIHTGFSGPGTGVYFDQLKQEFNETVNELLGENLTSYNSY